MTTQLEMVPEGDKEHVTTWNAAWAFASFFLSTALFLTRYLHLQQGQDFYQKYGNPAEGVREHYEEKPVGHGHVSVQSAPQVCGIDAGFIDGVEHAGVGEDDH